MRRQHRLVDARDKLEGVVGGPQRPECDGPAVPHQRHRGGADRGDAQHDEQRRGDGHRHPEAGHALDRAGEAPPDDERLRELVVGERGHVAANGVNGAEAVEDVVEEDGGPDDGEHEDGEVRALGGRDADVPPLGAEGQQREGDGEGARGGGGLLGGAATRLQPWGSSVASRPRARQAATRPSRSRTVEPGAS